MAAGLQKKTSTVDARPVPFPALKFIDLFSGIGGIRLAFENAGCRCVFSSEWDKFACVTYEENFGERPVGDIRAVSATNIPDHDPTQGTLFFEVKRILEEKRQRAFAMRAR